MAQGWEKVTPEMIKKCFRKAGILNGEFQIVACVSEGDDCDRQLYLPVISSSFRQVTLVTIIGGVPFY